MDGSSAEKLVVLSTPLAKAAIRADPIKAAAAAAASAASGNEETTAGTGGRYDDADDSEQRLEQLREDRIEELLDDRPRCKKALRALAGECARLRLRLEERSAGNGDAAVRTDGGSRAAGKSEGKKRHVTIETYAILAEDDEDDGGAYDDDDGGDNERGFLSSLINDLLEVLAPVPPAEKLRLEKLRLEKLSSQRRPPHPPLSRSQAASTSARSASSSGLGDGTGVGEGKSRNLFHASASSGTSRNVSPPAGVPVPQPSPGPATPRQLTPDPKKKDEAAEEYVGN